MELLVWAYKRTRELARRMPCFRGEFTPGHPVFASDSPAAGKAEAEPVPIETPDIAYSKEDEEAIEEFIKKTGACFDSLHRFPPLRRPII